MDFTTIYVYKMALVEIATLRLLLCDFLMLQSNLLGLVGKHDYDPITWLKHLIKAMLLCISIEKSSMWE